MNPIAVLAALPPEAGCVAVRDGTRTVIGVCPDEVFLGTGRALFEALDTTMRGWWAGYVAYEAGHDVERVVPRPLSEHPLPPVVLGRFDARAVIDGARAWIEGEGPSRAVLERAMRAAAGRVSPPHGPALRTWQSSLGRARYEDAVRAALERIRAGECYQVNLTRRLVCEREADLVGLSGALARRNPAPHAALIRLAGVGVVSASPEEFLRCEGGLVRTRPIKGTSTDPRALASSEKDRAENVMIVDLARNDLGRVCVPGSITVPSLCVPEQHPGLWHLVSDVTGRMRPEIGLGALLAATFPPASITGAPKPRVMQIIEDLEPVPRGVYCGAVGWIDADRGALDLSVAIRTFTVAHGRTALGVGAGIVADSDPRAEWEETELKAARLIATAAGERAEEAV